MLRQRILFLRWLTVLVVDCAAAVVVAVVVVVVAALVVEDWRRKWERWILPPVHLVQLERGLGCAFQIVHGELLLLVTQCLLAGNDLWFFYAWMERSLIRVQNFTWMRARERYLVLISIPGIDSDSTTGTQYGGAVVPIQ